MYYFFAIGYSKNQLIADCSIQFDLCKKYIYAVYIEDLAMRYCSFCSFVFDVNMEIFRSTQCPKCGKDVKICKNCVFYLPGAHWDCRETIEDQVKEKDKANFCSNFKFKDTDKMPETDQHNKNNSKKDFFKLFNDGN